MAKSNVSANFQGIRKWFCTGRPGNKTLKIDYTEEWVRSLATSVMWSDIKSFLLLIDYLNLFLEHFPLFRWTMEWSESSFTNVCVMWSRLEAIYRVSESEQRFMRDKPPFCKIISQSDCVIDPMKNWEFQSSMASCQVWSTRLSTAFVNRAVSFGVVVNKMRNTWKFWLIAMQFLN
jgi:hypothetical protein